MEPLFSTNYPFQNYSENFEQNLYFPSDFLSQNNIIQDSVQQKPVKFILTKIETSPSGFLKKKTQRKKGLSNGDMSNGRWTRDEQKRFAEAVWLFGSDWKKIQSFIKTRCGTQVRSHAQKFLMRLKENPNILALGLQKNLSWTKTIYYLSNKLSRDKLKEALEAVELGKNEPLKEKKEKVEKTEKIKKIRRKDKVENGVSKEKNWKKEKKEKKERNSMNKQKKGKAIGRNIREKRERLRKKRCLSFEKGTNGKKRRYLGGRRRSEKLKITLRLDQKIEKEENLKLNLPKSPCESYEPNQAYNSIDSNYSNNENNESNENEESNDQQQNQENNIPEIKNEESNEKNDELEKGQKQSKISSSTEVPDSEYGYLTRKEDEETGRFEERLNSIYSNVPIMKQRLIGVSPTMRRNSVDDEIELKSKNNTINHIEQVEHCYYDNFEMEETKNFYFKETTFEFANEELQRETLFG